MKVDTETTSLPLVEDAQRAYLERVEEAKETVRRAAQERRARQLRNAVEKLDRVSIISEPGDWLYDADSETARATLEGLVFVFDRDECVYLVHTCPDCGAEVFGETLPTGYGREDVLVQIGLELANPESRSQYHRCPQPETDTDEDLSEPSPAASIAGRVVTQTEADFLQLLKRLVADHSHRGEL